MWSGCVVDFHVGVRFEYRAWEGRIPLHMDFIHSDSFYRFIMQRPHIFRKYQALGISICSTTIPTTAAECLWITLSMAYTASDPASPFMLSLTLASDLLLPDLCSTTFVDLPLNTVCGFGGTSLNIPLKSILHAVHDVVM